MLHALELQPCVEHHGRSYDSLPKEFFLSLDVLLGPFESLLVVRAREFQGFPAQGSTLSPLSQVFLAEAVDFHAFRLKLLQFQLRLADLFAGGPAMPPPPGPLPGTRLSPAVTMTFASTPELAGVTWQTPALRVIIPVPVAFVGIRP